MDQIISVPSKISAGHTFKDTVLAGQEGRVLQKQNSITSKRYPALISCVTKPLRLNTTITTGVF